MLLWPISMHSFRTIRNQSIPVNRAIPCQNSWHRLLHSRASWQSQCDLGRQQKAKLFFHPAMCKSISCNETMPCRDDWHELQNARASSQSQCDLTRQHISKLCLHPMSPGSMKIQWSDTWSGWLTSAPATKRLFTTSCWPSRADQINGNTVNSLTTSWCFSFLANSKAVSPSCELWVDCIQWGKTLSAWFTSAPAAKRHLTISMWPYEAAKVKAVHPSCHV